MATKPMHGHSKKCKTRRSEIQEIQEIILMPNVEAAVVLLSFNSGIDSFRRFEL